MLQENGYLFAEAKKRLQEDFAEFSNAFKRKHDQICPIILEPSLQGAGRMWFYQPVRDRSEKSMQGLPFITDEIATGIFALVQSLN